jgi:restriction system protein
MRRSNSGGLGVLIAIGLIVYLVYQIKDAVSPELALWAIGIIVAISIVAAIGNWISTNAQLEQALKIVEQHAAELTVRRKQLTMPGHYGLVDDSRWHKEIDHFCSMVVLPRLPGALWRGRNAVRIRPFIEELTQGFESFRVHYSAALSPTDYEQLVADKLIDLGWNARATGATGDQGIDVIAIKQGAKLVVQCKLYSQPVGNDAVQEVIAGREFEQASYAAVVSNTDFTRAARQLASSARVLLLHHDQLVQLDSLLGLDDPIE